jgi:hypothetical protein
MTDTDFEVAETAPTDDEGHPIHPERGHRICGATKSDRTTPTEHGRERDEYEYCLLAAGWGVDGTTEGRWSHHFGAVDNRGSNNPNYKHGAYSEFEDFVYDSLSDRERDAVEAIDFDEHDSEFAETVVREAYAKYLRTGDDRFLREARQWAKEFGVIDRPADQLEVDATVDADHSLDEGTRAAMREALRRRRGEQS